VTAGLCALAGCGQASETVLVQMSATGSAPDGVATARFTIEEIRVLVDVPGSGPEWRTLVSDEEGGRTFDLLELGAGALVAERDVPAGRLLGLELSFDTDEPAEVGVLPFAASSDGGLELPLASPEAGAVHLQVEWNLAASVVRDGQGRLVLAPSAVVQVLP
jgi:hypothetical protein